MEYDFDWERPDFDFSDPSNHSKKGIFRVDDDFLEMVARASEEENFELAEIYENPLSDDEVEQYLFICTGLSCRTGLKLRQLNRDDPDEWRGLAEMAQVWLDRSKDMAERWLEDTPLDHPDYRHRLEIFKSMTMIQKTKKQDEEETEEMLVRFEEADRLEAEATELLETYNKTLNIPTLNKAIHKLAQANMQAAVRHPDFLFMLQKLIHASDNCFERTGESEYIDTIIDLLTMADSLFTEEVQNHLYFMKTGFNRPWYYDALGKAHADRYTLRDNQEDIEEAVRLAELSTNYEPHHPQRRMMVLNLAIWLERRFGRTSKLDDLRRAVELGKDAVADFPDDDPGRAHALVMYAGVLSNWFQQTRDVDHLNRAISLAENGIRIADPSSPVLPLWKGNLASLYSERHRHHGHIDDLNRAIDILKAVSKEKVQADYQQNGITNTNLGTLFWKRFDVNGDDNDLSLAISYGEKALKERAINNPERGLSLCNLSGSYLLRWERRGNRDDLDRAIKLATEAVHSISANHSQRTVALNTLSGCLGRRYELVGAMEDLTQAIKLLEEAVQSRISETSVSNAYIMITLGHQLCSRFDRTKSIDDINRAIELAEKALESTQKGTPDWAGWTGNLSKWLGKRATISEGPEDGDRSLTAAYEVIKATSTDAPHRGFYYTLMAAQIATGGYPTAVPRAIWLGEKAIQCTPTDHPERCNRLLNLGILYEMAPNYREALSYFKQSWDCKNAFPSIRVKAAMRMAEILAKERKWSESSEVLQDAILLVPTISPRMLNSNDKQQILLGLSGLASMTAAVLLAAKESPYKALSRLELGRGVIAGQLLDMRTDISPLKRKHPKIAVEFRRLRDELDAPVLMSGPGAPYTSLVSRRDQAEKELKELLTKIRKLKGFDNFLLPPTEDELKRVATKGPVIMLNISAYRCDALLLVKNQPIRTLQLEITEDEVKENSTHLRANGTSLRIALRWLWEKIANPILAELGFTSCPIDDHWPHVWWIATGPLTNFPLHAAGIHEKGSTDTVLDRVISSYSSSIRALMHGREANRTSPINTKGSHGKAVLIAMESTPPGPGLRPHRLPFATQEVNAVRKFCSSLGLVPVEPERQKESVLSSMRGCRLFHYAGHALSDRVEPSQGCLLLEDWVEERLTVGHVRDLNLSEAETPPFLAFLAACLTGSNDAERLVDEAINLVSACHLAGFDNVIGTLWEVWDQQSVSVSRIVYETIAKEGMTDEAVARGLHFAIRALRRGSITATVVKRGGEGIAQDLVHREDWTSDAIDDSDDEETCAGDGMDEDEQRNPDKKNQKSKILRANTDNPLVWAPYIHVGG